MINRLLHILGCIVLVTALGQAGTVAAMTVEDGKSLAQQYCNACHRVTREQAPPHGVAMDTESSNPEVIAAPSFQWIATDSKLTDAQLRDRVLRPHYPMREQLFIPEELDAILAYIISLRATTGPAADW